MSEQETTLQASFEELTGRVTTKAAELQAAESELSALVGKLVDAPAKERGGLIARRAELVNLSGLLKDELQELEARRDAAYLAIYIYRENQAAEEGARLAAAATVCRQAMQAASDALIHFRSRSGRGLQTEESAKELVKLQTDQARTIAESQIAAARMRKAQGDLLQAQAATEQARRELEAPALVM